MILLAPHVTVARYNVEIARNYIVYAELSSNCRLWIVSKWWFIVCAGLPGFLEASFSDSLGMAEQNRFTKGACAAHANGLHMDNVLCVFLQVP